MDNVVGSCYGLRFELLQLCSSEVLCVCKFGMAASVALNAATVKAKGGPHVQGPVL